MWYNFSPGRIYIILYGGRAEGLKGGASTCFPSTLGYSSATRAEGGKKYGQIAFGSPCITCEISVLSVRNLRTLSRIHYNCNGGIYAALRRAKSPCEKKSFTLHKDQVIRVKVRIPEILIDHHHPDEIPFPINGMSLVPMFNQKSHSQVMR